MKSPWSEFKAASAPECRRIWNELTGLGEWIKLEHLYPSALEIARETAHRIRGDIETLVPRLKAAGYRFSSPSDTHRPPDNKAPQRLATLLCTIGPIPLSLQAIFLHLGHVDLRGNHPDWPSATLYPLHFPALSDELLRAIMNAHHAHRPRASSSPFELPLVPENAPAAAHLPAMEGPLAIRTGFLTMDDVLIHQPHRTTLVDYFRLSLRSAGLPALPGHTMPAALERQIRGFTKGFKPF